MRLNDSFKLPSVTARAACNSVKHGSFWVAMLFHFLFSFHILDKCLLF